MQVVFHFMNRTKHIIEAPTHLGLKAPAPGQEPGVKDLPAWLRKHGLYDYINPKTVRTIPPPAYSMTLEQESGLRNAESITQYSKQLARTVAELAGKNAFLVVLGGDCSILLGTMLGLKKVGEYGLFFLDGHTDFIGPELSQTGGAAGMDLALATGYGPDKLTNIDDQQPYVQENRVWCVGNREYDASYVQPINESNVHYYPLVWLREQGVTSCADEFLAMVENTSLDGFWIHLDVDVLHDEIMPAVDSRQPDGLSYQELGELLTRLVRSEKAAGLQITILDPTLDSSGEITRLFVDNMGPILS